jgi:hypothetical protein
MVLIILAAAVAEEAMVVLVEAMVDQVLSFSNISRPLQTPLQMFGYFALQLVGLQHLV